MTNETTPTYTCDDAIARILDGNEENEARPADGPRDAALAAHVAGCTDCAAAWADLRATREALAAVAWSQPDARFEGRMRAGSGGAVEGARARHVADDPSGTKAARTPDRTGRRATSSVGSARTPTGRRGRRTRRLEVGLAVGALAGVVLALVRAFATLPDSTAVQPLGEATAKSESREVTPIADLGHSAGEAAPSDGRVRGIEVTANVTGTTAAGTTFIGVRFDPARINLPADVAASAGVTNSLRLPDIDLQGIDRFHVVDVPVTPPLEGLSSVRVSIQVVPDELVSPGTWLIEARVKDASGHPIAGVEVGVWPNDLFHGLLPESEPFWPQDVFHGLPPLTQPPWLGGTTDAAGQALIPLRWADLAEHLDTLDWDGYRGEDEFFELAIDFRLKVLTGHTLRTQEWLRIPIGKPGSAGSRWSTEPPPVTWLGAPATRYAFVRPHKDFGLQPESVWIDYAVTLEGALPAGSMLRDDTITPSGLLLPTDAAMIARLDEFAAVDDRLTRVEDDFGMVTRTLRLPPLSLDGLQHFTQRTLAAPRLDALGIPVPQQPATVSVALDIIPKEAEAREGETVLLVELRDADGRLAKDVPISLVLTRVEAYPRLQQWGSAPTRTWRPEASIDGRMLELAATRTDSQGYALWRFQTGDPRNEMMGERIRALSGFDRPDSEQSLSAGVQIHAGSAPYRYDPHALLNANGGGDPSLFEIYRSSGGWFMNAALARPRLRLTADGTRVERRSNPAAEAQATATAIAEAEHARLWAGPVVKDIRVTAETVGQPAEGFSLAALRVYPPFINLPAEIAEAAGVTDTFRLPNIEVDGIATRARHGLPIDPPLDRLSWVEVQVDVLEDVLAPPPGTWLLWAEMKHPYNGSPIEGGEIRVWTERTRSGGLPLDEQPWYAAKTDARGRALIPIPWSAWHERRAERDRENGDTQWPEGGLAVEFIRQTAEGHVEREVIEIELPVGQEDGPRGTPSPLEKPSKAWMGPLDTRTTVVESRKLERVP